MARLPNVQDIGSFAPNQEQPQPDFATPRYTPGLAGEGLAEAAGQTRQAVDMLQTIHNEASARDRQNQFQEWALQQNMEFQKLRGDEAAQAIPKFQADMDTKIQQLSGGLTPEAQRDFLNDAASQRFRINYTMASHAAQQYADSVHQTAETSKQLALRGVQLDPNNPDSYRKQYADAAVLQVKNEGGNQDAQDSTRTLAQAEFDKKRIEALPSGQQINLLAPIVERHTGQPVTTADDAINIVMNRFEGSQLVQNDSGHGPSKYGIVGSNNGLSPDEVANLTPDKAAAIYKKSYWDAIDADKLPENMRLVAFDTAVNFGVPRAKEMIAASDGDPEKLLQIRQQGYDSLVLQNPAKYGSVINSWNNRNAQLRSMIDAGSGKPMGDWRDNIPPADAVMMYKKAQDEQEIATKIQDKQLKDQQEQSMNDYLTRALKGESTAGIADDKTLTFEQREKVLTAINGVAKRGDQTDPAVFNGLLRRIYSDGADKLTNPDDLIPLVGNGIKYEDMTKLRAEMDGKGQPTADLKKTFFETAHKQLSGSNLMANDPAGEANYYNWYAYVNQLIDQKQKQGKSLSELLDPNSKDYVGGTIQQFIRSPQQQVQDMASRMRSAQNPTPLPPEKLRKPGESIDDYLKRTGG